MLAKPLTLLCVFLLTVMNFIIVMGVLSILVFPVFIFFKDAFFEFGPNVFFFLVSKTSGAIIVYIVVDTIFGFTLNGLKKNCVVFKKAKKTYLQEDIIKSFEWLKKKFGIRKVKLYLEKNEKICNAYAVGSFSGSAIIITHGLLNHIQSQTKSDDDYIDSVRAILGHEMAHLANKDFLPGLLAAATENVSMKMSRTIRLIFVIISKLLRLIPFLGIAVSKLIVRCYNIFNYVFMAFFRFIFKPIYNFLQNATSRSIEYRCDRESAYAYGGRKVARALSMLGQNGYFSIFSTHPTTRSRMNAVQDVLPKSGIIRPGIVNNLANILSVALILFVYIFSTDMADLPNMYHRYINELYKPAIEQINMYQHKIIQIYWRWKH